MTVMSSEMVARAAINPASLIMGWGLKFLAIYLRRHTDMSDQDIEEGLLEYRRFLILAVTHGGGISPSGPVDEIWHAHILHTQDYLEMCITIDRLIHHQPSLSDDEREVAQELYLDRTLPLYEQTFSQPPPKKWWPQKEGGECDAQCHVCNSEIE